MTPDPAAIAELERLEREATPGPWEEDSKRVDGNYGDGPDCGNAFDSYEMFGPKGKVLFDAINSEVVEVREENEPDGGVNVWDEVARRNFKFIVALRNNAKALIAAAKAQAGASDAEIAEIRKRHDGVEKTGVAYIPDDNLYHALAYAHADRATLLSAVAARDAEIGRLREHIKLHAGDTLSLDNEIQQMRDNAEEDQAEITRLRAQLAAPGAASEEALEKAARAYVVACGQDPDEVVNFYECDVPTGDFRWRIMIGPIRAALTAALPHLSGQGERERELLAALRPFAEFLSLLETHCGEWTTESSTWTHEFYVDGVRRALTYGDLLRAARAYASHTQSPLPGAGKEEG